MWRRASLMAVALLATGAAFAQTPDAPPQTPATSTTTAEAVLDLCKSLAPNAVRTTDQIAFMKNCQEALKLRLKPKS